MRGFAPRTITHRIEQIPVLVGFAGMDVARIITAQALELRQIKLDSSELENSKPQNWLSVLVRRPEQSMFFVPVVLMAILLVIKIDFGWNIVALALEGVMVVLGAFFAKERSFRLAGLALLLLCVLKFFVWDLWRLEDPRAPWISFIGLGALIIVAGYLYSKNRKALRDYL